MKFNCTPTNDNIIDLLKEKYNISYDFNFASMGKNVVYPEINKARQMIKKAKKPLLLVDSDADGISSASQLYYYFLENNIDATLLAHQQKSHGLSLTQAEEYIDGDYDILIISDSGSNNIQEIKKCLINNKPVLVLDHHIIEENNYDEIKKLKENKNYCIITPFLDKKLNENLTGAGVVLETLKPITKNKEFLFPIFTIGEISDVGDTSDQYIHEMVNFGLNHVDNNLLIKEFIDNSNNQQRDLSFTIIPVINAITRLGSQDDNILLVKLLANAFDENEKVLVKRKKKNKKTRKMEMVDFLENKYETAVLDLPKIKQKQNRLVDKIFKDIENHIVLKEEIVIAIFKKEDIDNNNSLTGLLANKIMSVYGRPALVMIDCGEYYTGSGRSNIDNSFKDYLSHFNIFEFIQGHDSAFGFKIDKDYLYDLIGEIKDNHYKSISDYENVDVVRTNVLSADFLEIENNKRFFGGKITYPKIGYQGIEFLKENCRQNKQTIYLNLGDVDVVLYKQPEGKLQELLNNGFSNTIKFDFIGEITKNTFSGNEKRIVVSKIERVEEDKKDIEKIWF